MKVIKPVGRIPVSEADMKAFRGCACSQIAGTILVQCNTDLAVPVVTSVVAVAVMVKGGPEFRQAKAEIFYQAGQHLGRAGAY